MKRTFEEQLMFDAGYWAYKNGEWWCRPIVDSPFKEGWLAASREGPLIRSREAWAEERRRQKDYPEDDEWRS